jgi:hypothetical protein
MLVERDRELEVEDTWIVSGGGAGKVEGKEGLGGLVSITGMRVG